MIKQFYFTISFFFFTICYINCQNDSRIELSFINKRWVLDTLYSSQNNNVQDWCFIVSKDSIDFKSKVSFGKDYIEITESNGKFIETQCHKKQYYIIDSIINNKEIWVTTWDHYMNECSKIYFYLDYPYLYKSTLKNKIGIIGHFTGSVMYFDADHITKKSPNIPPKLKIIVDQIDDSKSLKTNSIVNNESNKEYAEVPLNLYLIAYENQHSIISNNRSIVFENEKFVKTILKADIRDYYFNNYEVILNGFEIPVFTDIEISNLDVSGLQNFIEINNFSFESFVAIFHRYNPGKERIVNVAFGEDINCQVQSFEIINFKELIIRLK